MTLAIVVLKEPYSASEAIIGSRKCGVSSGSMLPPALSARTTKLQVINEKENSTQSKR